MQVYFHCIRRPCLSFCLWHPSRGAVVKCSILPQGKVLSEHWNGTTRYIIHLSPNPCEKYRLTFLLSPWSHLRRLQERAGDPWKRSEKPSLLTLQYTITNLNVCHSICYLWRHIYSVKSCHFFRARWKRLIRGTSAAPRRLLMKSHDGADEDLLIFLSAVFTICRSLHLRSPGKRWHPTDRNVRRGWRSKVLACPGASDNSLHKSWSLGWARVSWQGSRPRRRPAGAGQGGKTPQGAPSPVTGPQTQQASTQRLWQLRQSVKPPLRNRTPPPLGEEMGKGTRRHRGQHLLSATRPTWRQPFATRPNIRESRLTFFPWASAARPFPPAPAAAQSSSGKMAQPPGEWGGPPRWPRLFPSLPLWPGCVSLCAAAPLKDMKLMDVKLGQLPTWLAMRDFTPGGILGALRRGEGGWGEGARPPCRNSSAPPRPAKTWRVWIPSPDGARQISV